MSSHTNAADTIRARLFRAMKSGEYSSCAHLPPEKELAETLGISRTQLRDVLAALEREGFITRRHGVGTLINHHVLNVPNRMDIETEFLDMIRQSGFAPGLASVQISESSADEKIAQILRLDEGAPIIRVARLCTADGKPAIYCEDIFDKSLIRESYTIKDLKQPIFQFLQDHCGVSPYLDVTDLSPMVADAALAELFQVPVGTPVLNMQEVDFDVDGIPVLFSVQYFIGGIVRHTVLRKKL